MGSHGGGTATVLVMCLLMLLLMLMLLMGVVGMVLMNLGGGAVGSDANGVDVADSGGAGIYSPPSPLCKMT